MNGPRKHRLISIAVSLASVIAQVASGEPTTAVPSVDRVVAAVQARYDSTLDLAADVTQETTLARLNKRVMAKGTLVFRKPGMMRWELANGQRELIVSDGQTLWLYRPEDQQVIRMPVAKAFRSDMPVSFLTGVGRIQDDFVVSLESVDGGRFRLRLVPKKADSDVGMLWLEVDSATYDIVGAEVKDPLGNTSKLTLENAKRNTGVSDKVFRFEIPPGVDVLDTPQG